MEAVAHLNFDRQYYEAMYSDWWKYRSKYRRVAVPIALTLTGLGLAGAAWLSSPPLAIITAVVGAADLIETATYRRRWMTRVHNPTRGKTAELRFTDSEIHVKSDYSEGRLRYEALQSAIATPNSIFLIPETGASLFVPFASIEPQSVVESLVDIVLTSVNRGRNINQHVA